MPRTKLKRVNTGGKSKAKRKGNATAAPAVVGLESEVQPEVTSEVLSVSAEPLTLPDCLDSAAAVAVKDMLLERRGSALVIDASHVRRVGAQSLQILVSAARTWAADGLSFSLTNASSEFLDTIALVGLPREDLLLEG